MNVLLIGYRGTGKTTVGRLVAARLNLEFVDADVELERRAGRTIREIFASDGESGFRDLESQVVADLVGRDHMVIALGGGAILREENRRAMAAPQNRAVWLQAHPSTLLARIESDPTTSARRPNLTASGGREEIERLLAAREPLYRECADFIIDTEGKAPEQIASEIVSLLTAVDEGRPPV